MTIAPRVKTRHMEVLPLLPGRVRLSYGVPPAKPVSRWSEDMSVEELLELSASMSRLAVWCNVHGAKETKA